MSKAQAVSQLVAGSSVILATLLNSSPVLAEGTAQVGATQRLYEYGFTSSVLTNVNRPLYVDIVSPGEVINISLCATSLTDNIRIEIYDPFGSQVVNTTLSDGNFGNSSCQYTFSSSSPLPNPFQYTTTTSGTYEIRLFNLRTFASFNTDDDHVFRLFDVTVAPNTSTPVYGTERQGRLHTISWAYRANTNDFSEAGAADSDYYVKVPGGRPGENFVWFLDLNNFAGLTYEIVGNDIGVDAPNSGFSTNFTGNSITPLYPIYLSYPEVVDPPPTSPPALNNLRFIDSDGVDNTISPGASSGVQDSGTFEFTTDVEGTYAIIIDINQDGIFAPGDVYLVGRTNLGANSVFWDGKDNAGNVLPVGEYDVTAQVRVGEYHFVAGDAETSGGPVQPGLTIFQALSQNSSIDTLVYWDDFTFLGGTTTLPNGALSSTAAARHSWGTFSGSGFGNTRYIDTYVYGNVSPEATVVIISDNDIPVNSDYGDAPDTSSSTGSGNYQTTEANGGPRHTIIADLHIGAAPDSDSGTLQNALANADDDLDLADEGNITFGVLSTTDTSHTLGNITVTNNTGTNANLVGWIDFDQSGTFDSDEAATVAVPSTVSGSQTVNLNWFSLPADIVEGTTYARFRLTTDTRIATGTATTSVPTGGANDGEVEDYQITINGLPFPPSPVTGPGDGNACVLTVHQNNITGGADPNSFYSIDDHTNVATLIKIGPWNVSSGTVEALTADPGTNTFYAFNGARGGALYLGTIDESTGAFSDITTSGITTLSHTDYGSLNVSDTRSIAFQPGTNIIWAIGYDAQPSSGPGNTYYYLFQLNATTGQVITDAFGAGKDYLAIDLAPYQSNSTQRATVEAIAFYPGAPNILYGVVSSYNPGSTNVGHLFAVDLSMATPTAVLAPKNLDGIDFDGSTLIQSTIYDIEGMSFDDNGDLVLLASNAGGSNSNSLFFADLATGATLNQRVILNGDWEGIVCNVPPPIASNPNVLLVKRITNLNSSSATSNGDNLALYLDDPNNPYDDNIIPPVSDPKNAAYDPNDPSFDPLETEQWPNITTNLLGGIDGGNVMPNDEIEYTIYYLSSGNAIAESVLFCDYVPSFTDFIPNAYVGSSPQATGGIGGADLSIELFRNGSTNYHTGANDGDSATYFGPGIDPANSFPGIDCDGDSDGINANTNGAVVVNLGDLPDATTDATGAYGHVRFRTRVK